jgi:hypothetical protein
VEFGGGTVTVDRSESGTFNFNPYSTGDEGDERDKVKGETQFGWRRTPGFVFLSS